MRSGWRYDADLMKRTLKFGVPSGLQWALEGLAFSIFLVFIGRMSNGDAALAASGIVVTVMMLAVLPALQVWPKPCRCSSGQHQGKNGPRNRKSRRGAGGFDVHPPVDLTFDRSFRVFYLSWFCQSQPGTLGAGSHHRAVPDVHHHVHIL